MTLSLDERSTRYDLELFSQDSTIGDNGFVTIASALTSEQLERLAVRILYTASYCANDEMALLKKYNLPISDDGLPLIL